MASVGTYSGFYLSSESSGLFIKNCKKKDPRLDLLIMLVHVKRNLISKRDKGLKDNDGV
jgi:hypothetical protein